VYIGSCLQTLLDGLSVPFSRAQQSKADSLRRD
jgi:hypothetical protein